MSITAVSGNTVEETPSHTRGFHALNDWASCIHQNTLQAAKTFLLEKAVSPEQHTLFSIALEDFQSDFAETRGILTPYVHLPALIYRAHCDSDHLSEKLALLTTLIEIGIRLLDNIADHDLNPCWKGVPLDGIRLIAYTIMATLPPLLILELPIPGEIQLNMLRLLMQYFLAISAGQEGEILNKNVSITDLEPAHINNTVQGKTGMWRALYAALAVCLATGARDFDHPCVLFAKTLGKLRQLANDLYDLFVAPISQDLANGIQTLPLVTYVQTLNATDKNKFLALLQTAHEIPIQQEIRRQLLAAGQLQVCVFLLEMYRYQALAKLRTFPTSEFVKEGLEALVQQTRICHEE